MKKRCIIQSERLCLRQWVPSDIQEFYALCSDEDVMEFFPATMTLTEVEKSINRFSNHIRKHGFGFFATEIKETNEFIGFIGFQRLEMEADFTPCIEIGWRLKKDAWGKGFATEGAKACIQYVFDENISSEIYSFTAEINKRSERVMQKIGMSQTGYFDHPKLDKDSPLLRHVLYKINKDEDKV